MYRADLQRHPHNVWALVGLVGCIEARGGGADGNGEGHANGAECCAEGMAGSGECMAAADAQGFTFTVPASELADLRGRLADALRQCDVVVRHSCFCAGMGK